MKTLKNSSRIGPQSVVTQKYKRLIPSKPLIVIVGPTAVGKTRVAVQFCRKFPVPTEIISADSMQVYKILDIGTDKPGASTRKEIPHHMIDFVAPGEAYSVGRYQKEAQEAILSVYAKEKLPLVVGGTGLYINALIYDFSMGKLPQRTQYREQLEERVQNEGLGFLYEELKKYDPSAARKIHPNDKRRIIRGLEVYYYTGEPISKQQTKRYQSPYNLCTFGLYMEREKLYSLIEKRIDRMLAEGLLNEVQFLKDNGYKHTTAMQGLGYKELNAYLEGEMGYQEAVKKFKKNTRRFAKKQLSWFRRDPNIEWIDLTNLSANEAANKIFHCVMKEYFNFNRI